MSILNRTERADEDVINELKSLLKQFGIDKWTFTPEQNASYLAAEKYRQEQKAFLQSKEYLGWIEQFSCDYTLIAHVYAVPLGYASWDAIENFFDLIEYGGTDAVPHCAKEFTNCLAYRGDIRIEWSDRFESINTPRRFILIPTSVIPENTIAKKLAAYEEQSLQPVRLRLKDVDVKTICKNFENYAKLIRTHNESLEEFEFRMMQMFIKIYDFAKLEKTTESIKT